MSTPKISDLTKLYDTAKSITQKIFTSILDIIVEWLTDGSADFNINSLNANSITGPTELGGILSVVAGEQILKDKIVRIGDDGRGYLGDNSTNEGISNIVGFNSSDAVEEGDLIVFNTSYDKLTGLTSGKTYYLGTNGDITETLPINFPYEIGVAQNMTTIFITNRSLVVQGEFIDQQIFESDGNWTIPTVMTDKGYIDVVIVGGGSGALYNSSLVGSDASDSSFGLLVSAEGGISLDVLAGIPYIYNGGIAATGVGGDINIIGGTDATVEDTNNNTHSGESGGSLFSNGIQLGSLLQTGQSVSNSTTYDSNYGGGGVITSISQNDIASGGNGGGTAIKRIPKSDFNFINALDIGVGPGTNILTSLLLGIPSSFLYENETLISIDLTSNISNIIAISDGKFMINSNNDSFGFVNLDFTTATDITGIVLVLQTFITNGSYNLTVTNSENSLIFSTNITEITVSIGSGSIGRGTNATDGIHGVCIVKAYR